MRSYNLTVDGAGKGNSNVRFFGVAFRNAGGEISNVTVKDVRDTPFSGAQHGVGVYSYNDDGIGRTIKLLDSTIVGFQKNATAFIASDTTPLALDIHGNTITGAGTTTVTAQNGIQIQGRLATGSVTDNIISGIAYGGTGWVATAILDYYSAVNIQDNTLTACHTCIYKIESSGEISGNTLSVIKAGGYSYGIVATDPPGAPPAPYAEAAAVSGDAIPAAAGPAATLAVSVIDNVVSFSGADNASSYGIEVDSGYSPDDIAFTATGNTVSGFEVGVEVYQCQSSCDTGVLTAANVNQNSLAGNTIGIRSNLSYLTVNGENNWWGSACGPTPGAAVVGDVDFDPWWLDATGTATGTTGSLAILAGSTTAQQQEVLDCAANSTITYQRGTYPGGLLIRVPNVTIDLNGATVGHGSSAYTILDDDVILENGILDGAGDPSPGVLVADGADNFILQDMEIKNWLDGVVVAGSHESLKIVNNWLHLNDNGLQFNADLALTGILTIEGNLFKANTGPGLYNEGTTEIDAEYNSWGHVDGPDAGDGVSANVDADPWAFSEIYFDVDPTTAGDQYVRHVNETNAFDVTLLAEAENLNALSFKFTYDAARLTLNSTAFAGDWAGKCTALPGQPAGTLAYWCAQGSATEWDGGAIATLGFTANAGPTGPGPWIALFDVAPAVADTSAAAVGGVKVWMNNAGFDDPSAADRDITDGDDGRIIIDGLANYTGFVDLQGRANDSGALFRVYDQALKSGATVYASGTTASGGKYTTAYVSTWQLVIGQTYWFQVDRALYLPTTAVASYAGSPIPDSWQHFKVLLTRPLQSVATVMLLGGDATNNDVIESGDASCIGGVYGIAPQPCGAGGTSDVNEDGRMDILDLTLMGGNFGKTASPAPATWAP